MFSHTILLLVALNTSSENSAIDLELIGQQTNLSFFDQGYVDLLNTLRLEEFPLREYLEDVESRANLNNSNLPYVLSCHDLAIQHVRSERSRSSEWTLSGLGSRSGELPSECRVAYNAITNPREPRELVPGTLELLVSALRTFREDYYIQELARSSEGWWDDKVRLVYLSLAMRTIVSYHEPSGLIRSTAAESTERAERQDRERTNILRTLCEEEFAVGCFYYGALSTLPTSSRERVEALQKYLNLGDPNEQRNAIAEQRLSQLMESL